MGVGPRQDWIDGHSGGWMKRVLVLAAVAFAMAVSSPATAGELEDAMALHQTKANAASRHERELAHYRLAIALYRLKLVEVAYGLFSEIADQPSHVRFDATLVWLGRILSDLPDSADVDERVSRYDAAAIERVKLESPELYWRLQYRLGRFHYKNRHYDAALRVLASVDPKSTHYPKAQFFAGMANVQMRRAVEAVHAFQRAVRAIDEGSESLDPEGRVRDLALLSIARVYYSTAVRVDAEGDLAFDKQNLATAINTYDAVDPAGEWWINAAFETSWAYFVRGDHARALGFVQTIGAFYPLTWDPGLDLLRTTVYFANCQYDDAATLAARFHTRYEPVAIELAKTRALLDRADRDESYYRFLKDVRDGRSNLMGGTRSAVESALSDRELLRHLQYVTLIEDEQKRFAKMPKTFVASPLGRDIADALELAHDLAVRHTSQLARARYERAQTELTEQLEDNVRILTAAIAGQRGELDPRSIPFRVKPKDAEKNVVKNDDEHVIWPFTGELWPDEKGTFRQSIRSSCTR